MLGTAQELAQREAPGAAPVPHVGRQGRSELLLEWPLALELPLESVVHLALALDLLLEVASNLKTIVPPALWGLGPVVTQLDLALELPQELMLEPEPLWRWCRSCKRRRGHLHASPKTEHIPEFPRKGCLPRLSPPNGWSEASLLLSLHQPLAALPE